MTNEKQDALRALDRVKMQAYDLEHYPDDEIERDLKTIRAALTEAPKVDVEGLKRKPDLTQYRHDYTVGSDDGWNDAIDHLTTHYDLVKKEK